MQNAYYSYERGVCLSVCPSHADNVSKLRNVGSRGFTVEYPAVTLVFDTKLRRAGHRGTFLATENNEKTDLTVG